MAILTSDEAKRALNIKTSEFDADLPDYIAAAQECVDFLCGPTEPITVVETRHGYIEIALTTTPVLTVTSVIGQTFGALNMSTLFVNNSAGTIRAKSLFTPIIDDYYEITYTAGRATVPMAIKQGIRIILKHQWDTRRGASTARPNIGGSDTSAVSGLGYAIPNRALEILDRYMTGPSVA